MAGGEPQQRQLTTGPADTEALAGPERAEGGQDDHRGSGTEHRRAERTGGATEGDHHDGDLEPFEGDALGRQHEAGPVEPSGPQVGVVDVLLARADRPSLRGDAEHSLAQPLQPEGTLRSAVPSAVISAASTTSPAPAPTSAARQERVLPTATTIATISITSMAAAGEVAAPTVTFVAVRHQVR